MMLKWVYHFVNVMPHHLKKSLLQADCKYHLLTNVITWIDEDFGIPIYCTLYEVSVVGRISWFISLLSFGHVFGWIKFHFTSISITHLRRKDTCALVPVPYKNISTCTLYGYKFINGKIIVVRTTQLSPFFSISGVTTRWDISASARAWNSV